MEKKKPTYALSRIKAAIGSVETLAMTGSALRDALALGFDRHAIVETINGIEASTGIIGSGRMSTMCQRVTSSSM